MFKRSLVLITMVLAGMFVYAILHVPELGFLRDTILALFK
jgi:hypothetical protein